MFQDQENDKVETERNADQSKTAYMDHSATQIMQELALPDSAGSSLDSSIWPSVEALPIVQDIELSADD